MSKILISFCLKYVSYNSVSFRPKFVSLQCIMIQTFKMMFKVSVVVVALVASASAFVPASPGKFKLLTLECIVRERIAREPDFSRS